MTEPDNNPATVLLITNDGMGTADKSLQHKLITTYFKLLKDSNTLPAVIGFYTEGVKLVTSGSPVLDVLRQLEAKGVHLL